MFTNVIHNLDAAFRPNGRATPASISAPANRMYWGGDYLDPERKLHSLLLGTTRSGKTSLLRIACQNVLPLVRTRPNTFAQLYDPKQEMISILDGMGLLDHTIIVNPYDRRARSWLPYVDCADDQSCQVFAEQVATKETTKDGGESHFTKTERSLIKAVCCALNRRKTAWMLRDVLLAIANPTALNILLSPYYDTANTLRLALYQRHETAQDVFSTINNFVNRYSDIAALWHHASKERPGFSVQSWVGSNQIIVLPGVNTEGDPLNCLTQLIFDRTADAILALPEAVSVPHPPLIYTILDEARQAGKLRKLQPLLFRSAGRGNRVMINAQGVEGMHDAYGEKGAEEIFSLCANKSFTRAGSDTTAEWMSRQIHKQIVKEAEQGVSRSKGSESTTTTTRRVERNLVQSIRFMRLKTPETDDGVEGYFIAPELRAFGRSVYWRFIPSTRLFSGPDKLVWDRGSAPDFLPRPPEQQILTPWDEADLERLKLPSSVRSGFNSTNGFLTVTRELFAT